MLHSVVSLLALVGIVAGQLQNYEPETGTRSLWIPYKTISGVPQASIVDRDPANNRTTYILHCPTAQPDCAISPRLKITEGTDLVRWTSSTSGASSGTVVIDCPLTASPVVCNQNAHGGGQIQQTSVTVAASDILYQAVDVTALQKKPKETGKNATTKKAAAKTTTATATPTPTSTGGVAVATGNSWVGAVGVVGAGLAALAAL